MIMNELLTAYISPMVGAVLTYDHRMEGQITVISGDVLVVQDQCIHLYEINAPETGQTYRC